MREFVSQLMGSHLTQGLNLVVPILLLVLSRQTDSSHRYAFESWSKLLRPPRLARPASSTQHASRDRQSSNSLLLHRDRSFRCKSPSPLFCVGTDNPPTQVCSGLLELRFLDVVDLHGLVDLHGFSPRQSFPRRRSSRRRRSSS